MVTSNANATTKKTMNAMRLTTGEGVWFDTVFTIEKFPRRRAKARTEGHQQVVAGTGTVLGDLIGG
jgi:hypothetical protein